ncbi:MAG: aminotransferase class V-fold PLP-dependent enzyme [Phycisphaerales bacterium]|jgi:cysteine desulfurase family protein|nr:aminotransferase class V-fold PLP-dependent enzyme [Phycisphaerales bacterium]
MSDYFDNAATSFPKPNSVHEAMLEYHLHCGASPGRGAYAKAIDASSILDRCRESLCRLINAPSPRHCIFTLNCTDALNLAITGTALHFLRGGDEVHIVTTAMDHNSVLRPLHELGSLGVQHTIVPADPQGFVDATDIARAITPATRLIAVAHGSNVSGSLQDLSSIAAIRRGIPLLVDAAQTMGHLAIDMQALDIDLLAFPGHKGLLGPLGTGGLLMRPGAEDCLAPVRAGGTGSWSDEPVQPMALPDRFEAGSHNTVGLAGLAASVEWILSEGIGVLWERECRLVESFISTVRSIDGVRLVGPPDGRNRCGVFSLVFEGLSPAEAARSLERISGIQCRAGLHCAPFAHKALGTDAIGGTVRLSLGPFHDEIDITRATHAIEQICAEGGVLA